MVTYNSRNDGIAYHFLIDCKKKKKCQMQDPREHESSKMEDRDFVSRRNLPADTL